MTFSDKIKVAREQAGLTQQQLADSTGVSKRTIASYESGGAIARASTMLKLAKALNVSSKYLSDDSCLDPMADIEKDGYLEEARERYNIILAAADLVRFICPGYSRACFQIRNEWMVDHSALVIAVFNGQPSGTKNTIDYANRKGVAYRNILSEI